LPWEGSVVIGTTDRTAPRPSSFYYHRIRALNDATFAGTAALQDLPTPTLEDVNWMLAESNKFMTRQVQRNEVLASWSGKPLLYSFTTGFLS
jgi:glycerol-3-phosphate dehydrogenase